jgi:hypothetical protein
LRRALREDDAQILERAVLTSLDLRHRCRGIGERDALRPGQVHRRGLEPLRRGETAGCDYQTGQRVLLLVVGEALPDAGRD